MVSGSPRNVMRVITRLNVGGPARQALLLSKELEAWQTTLVVGVPGPNEGELSDPEVPTHHIPLQRSLDPVRDLRAFRDIQALLRARPYDIVHTHMAKAGALGRLAAASSDARIVHTFHGHVLEGYFPKPLQRVFVEAERRLARRTDLLIAVSPEIRDQLLDLGIGRPEQWRVVPLGFDLSSFLSVDGPSGKLRSELGIDPETPLVGVLGRLAPIKGHRDLLESFVGLPDAHLAILGDGELRRDLERRAHSLRIADRVHFVGWWDDVAAAISDMDLVVLSSHNEGTPVSLIEGLAAGRPVVATRVGGVSSVVDDGVNGLLVDPGDVVSMRAAITQLLNDPPARREMGAKGREKAALAWDKGRLLGEINDLYENLVSRVPPSVTKPKDADREVAETLESFGYEWTKFDKIQPEDQQFWKRYFADVPMDALSGKLVLDAGCGKGRFSYFTAPLVGNLVALDGSLAVLAARKNLSGFSNASVVQGDLRRIPLKPETFDLVFCLGVLHHLPDPREGFRNLVRFVRPGGRLLIYVYSRAPSSGVRASSLAAAAALRRITVRLPRPLLRFVTLPIALFLYLGFVAPGALGDRFGLKHLQSLPLQTYRRRPFRSLWLDTFDRLSAPTEARYVWTDLKHWFDEAGLNVEAVREDAGWFVFASKPGGD